MTRGSIAHLKHPTGWFAAGQEVARAISLLSDSAFKLYVYLCLQADRRTGRIQANQEGLASVLHKNESQIASDLNELCSRGVCQAGPQDQLVIADSFWPYRRLQATDETADQTGYVAEVKRILLAHSCVKSLFSAADEKLAAQLFANRVPLERVRRAILLGCLRKYTTLITSRGGTAITSLNYFSAIFSEVAKTEVSEEYWRYVAANVERLEREWQEKRRCREPTETK